MAILEDKLTLAAWNAAAEGRGNVKLVWGTYTGTGEYGAEHPVTLTFDGKPLQLVVRPTTSPLKEEATTMVYGAEEAETTYGTNTTNVVAWNGNTVSWYNKTGSTYGFNISGYTYYYIALLGI